MLPDGWKKCFLGELVDGTIKNGFSANPVEKISGMYILSLGCLTDDGLSVDQIKNIDKNIYLSEYILQPGDFLVSRSNTPDKVGRSAMFRGEIKNCIYPDLMMRFRVKKTVSANFIESVLKHFSARQYLKKSASGSSLSMVKITKATLEKLPVTLPPLPEQEKIAAILSTWDKAISTTDALLENSRQQKKALMQQLLTGKRRLPGFKGEWKGYSLGSLLREIKRPVTWDDNSFYKLLSVKRRSEGVILREILQGKNILTKKMNEVYAGDFLISKMQVVHGAMGIVPDKFHKFHISDSYIALIPKNDKLLYMPFFDYFSRQQKMYHMALISSYGVHIEKMTFNISLFLKKQITIPVDIHEQRAIAVVLDAADREITLLEQKAARLREEKKALMQQLLTGKRRVRV